MLRLLPQNEVFRSATGSIADPMELLRPTETLLPSTRGVFPNGEEKLAEPSTNQRLIKTPSVHPFRRTKRFTASYRQN